MKNWLLLWIGMFYFSINFGSIFGMVLTPMLKDKACFGEETCFSLPFGIMTVMMIASIGKIPNFINLNAKTKVDFVLLLQ